MTKKKNDTVTVVRIRFDPMDPATFKWMFTQEPLARHAINSSMFPDAKSENDMQVREVEFLPESLTVGEPLNKVLTFEVRCRCLAYSLNIFGERERVLVFDVGLQRRGIGNAAQQTRDVRTLYDLHYPGLERPIYVINWHW